MSCDSFAIVIAGSQKPRFPCGSAHTNPQNAHEPLCEVRPRRAQVVQITRNRQLSPETGKRVGEFARTEGVNDAVASDISPCYFRARSA
jgi:hypothetical protein